jgi:hypothetical protein
VGLVEGGVLALIVENTRFARWQIRISDGNALGVVLNFLELRACMA